MQIIVPLNAKKKPTCGPLQCMSILLVSADRTTCQLGPRYEGQLTRMAEPIPPSGQSSSYSLTTLSSSRSTDRRAETDRMVGDADAGMRTILDTV